MHDLSSFEQYRLRRQTQVLVILFTDIKGSTELTERRGERYTLLTQEKVASFYGAHPVLDSARGTTGTFTFL